MADTTLILIVSVSLSVILLVVILGCYICKAHGVFGYVQSSIQLIIHTSHYKQYAQCTLYSIQCTVYNVHLPLYNVGECTMYNVICALCDVHSPDIQYITPYQTYTWLLHLRYTPTTCSSRGGGSIPSRAGLLYLFPYLE